MASAARNNARQCVGGRACLSGFRTCYDRCVKRIALPPLATALSGLLLMLVACDKGENKRPAPPPPTPTGVLKGRVTATINGPGRAHAPSESFSRTTPIECTVTAIDRSGTPFDAKTRADGAYEVTVPAGHYEVSFNDCLGPRSCAVPTPMPIEVPPNAAATLDWGCEMDAK